MKRTDIFEAQRPRLLRLAAGVLDERVEAEDVVQQAWLRLHGTDAVIDSLPAWLTTVTTRLCLDRLRARIPAPR
ncbi:MAG: sigma factor, partial [Mycobacteriaceae bacterium]